MPLYEYRCDACGRTFEELRSSSEADAAIECPSCESRKTSRKRRGARRAAPASRERRETGGPSGPPHTCLTLPPLFLPGARAVTKGNSR